MEVNCIRVTTPELHNDIFPWLRDCNAEGLQVVITKGELPQTSERVMQLMAVVRRGSIQNHYNLKSVGPFHAELLQGTEVIKCSETNLRVSDRKRRHLVWPKNEEPVLTLFRQIQNDGFQFTPDQVDEPWCPKKRVRFI